MNRGKFLRIISVICLVIMIIGSVVWYLYAEKIQDELNIDSVTMSHLKLSNNVSFILALLTVVLFIILILDLYCRFLNEKKKRAGYNDYRKAVRGVSKLFDKFTLVDFETLEYRYIVNTSPEGNKIPKEGKYEDFVNHLKNLVVMDKDKIYKYLSVENIMNELSDVDIMKDDFKVKRKNRTIWENIAVICVEREEGVPKKVLVTNQDVDKRKKIELEVLSSIEEAKNQADNANKSKSLFLSRMSHDIRTPLNAILGMSKIGHKYIKDEEKITDALNKIEVSSNHLLRLVNEVLDMSKIESGKLSLLEEKLDIENVFDRSLELLMSMSEPKEQTIEIKKDIKNKIVIGDIARLEEIMFNIVGNAIKFSPVGGNIMVSVTEEKSSMEGYGDYVLVVRDSGRGIEHDDLEKIFEPFFRTQHSSGNQIEGTGLGLPIVKRIVKMMNGDIKVESKVGYGSTFIVNVNLKHSNDIITHNITVNDYSKISALIVDDNDFNIEIAKEFLIDTNMNCDEAKNGIDAINMAKNKKYDIIFMDIQMDGMNGYEACKKIREFDKETIIVAMTADAFVTDIEKALNSGMNDHISKPIEYDKLMECLNKWL
ncbi:MAG: hybrid sensor histidine kinase/response regulator [Anaeroplasmataceae bacterium]